MWNILQEAGDGTVALWLEDGLDASERVAVSAGRESSPVAR